MIDPFANEPEDRRIRERGPIAQAATAARVTSRTFWQWFSDNQIDSLSVLAVTLWLSIRVIDWALEFGYAEVPGTSGAERAGIIAAVLGPWGLSQAAMCKWYMELKAKNGNYDNAKSLLQRP